MFQYFSRRSPHAKFRDGLIFAGNFNILHKKISVICGIYAGQIKILQL